MIPIKSKATLMFILGLSVALTTGASANFRKEAVDESFDTEEHERVCHIESPTSASVNCKNGDIMLFIPRRISSNTTKESIILASLVCDFRYEVMHSSEALSCVFTTKRKQQWTGFGME